MELRVSDFSYRAVGLSPLRFCSTKAAPLTGADTFLTIISAIDTLYRGGGCYPILDTGRHSTMCETIQPIRLMLLDDHEFILCGMQYILGLSPDFEILGQFTRSRDLLAALRQVKVDVVVMDFALGPDETDGLNLIRAIKIKFPDVHLLVISATHTPATVSLALRCGASGFISKDNDPIHLQDGIRALAAGEVYLEPRMATLLEDRDISTQVPGLQAKGSKSALEALVRTNDLTLREREVLRCCLAGMSVTQVAEKFSRSIKTISTQKQSAFRKLGLSSDNELFRMRSQLENR